MRRRGRDEEKKQKAGNPNGITSKRCSRPQYTSMGPEGGGGVSDHVSMGEICREAKSKQTSQQMGEEVG
jgi:hypothetical protein